MDKMYDSQMLALVVGEEDEMGPDRARVKMFNTKRLFTASRGIVKSKQKKNQPHKKYSRIKKTEKTEKTATNESIAETKERRRLLLLQNNPYCCDDYQKEREGDGYCYTVSVSVPSNSNDSTSSSSASTSSSIEIGTYASNVHAALVHDQQVCLFHVFSCLFLRLQLPLQISQIQMKKRFLLTISSSSSSLFSLLSLVSCLFFLLSSFFFLLSSLFFLVTSVVARAAE